MQNDSTVALDMISDREKWRLEQLWRRTLEFSSPRWKGLVCEAGRVLDRYREPGSARALVQIIDEAIERKPCDEWRDRLCRVRDRLMYG